MSLTRFPYFWLMEQVCNNCGNAFSSPYCPVCGQKAGTGRLTLHGLLHEVWHGFTHTDKGVIKLFTDLLLRPAVAYTNYFNGRRKSYFSPVIFFLLSFGLYIFFDQKVFDYQDHVVFERTGHLYNNEVGRYVQEHLKYIALTLLPFQSLLALALFYRRRNLAECIVFWLFCVGFTNVILTLLTPLRLLFIDQKSTVDFALTLVTMVIYFIQAIAVFGRGPVGIIKVAAMIFIVSIVNTYVAFFYLAQLINAPYPTFAQVVRITFANASVTYMNGKTTIE